MKSRNILKNIFFWIRHYLDKSPKIKTQSLRRKSTNAARKLHSSTPQMIGQLFKLKINHFGAMRCYSVYVLDWFIWCWYIFDAQQEIAGLHYSSKATQIIHNQLANLNTRKQTFRESVRILFLKCHGQSFYKFIFKYLVIFCVDLSIIVGSDDWTSKAHEPEIKIWNERQKQE